MERRGIPDRLVARAVAVENWVDRLRDDLEGIVGTLEEHWPAAMVRQGFEDHFWTWGNSQRLVRGLEREVTAFGGFEALEPSTSEGDRELRVRTPGEIVHLWPNLPGAGVTPMLYGALVGADQSIRPPTGGDALARRLADHWNATDELPPLDVRSSDDRAWTEADVVVVSGTDATLREVRRRVLEETGGRNTTVTGYGHRISFGLVPDSRDLHLREVAREMARDAVLWNQAGCFSLRGVLVAGSDARRETFCRRLGSEIAEWERRLDAIPETGSASSVGVFDRSVQARQVAEFEGRLFGEGFGWAEWRETPFRGDWVSLHTVTCHPIDSPDEIREAVDVEPWHLQGVASPDHRSHPEWCEELSRTGATRICSPGRLHVPPPDWLHDGRLNVAEWLRATTCDR